MCSFAIFYDWQVSLVASPLFIFQNPYILKLIFYIKILFLEHGNTTTYEWIHKEKPSKVEEPSFHISVDEDEAKKEDAVSKTLSCVLSYYLYMFYNPKIPGICCAD